MLATAAALQKRWWFQLEASHANSVLLWICTCWAVVWVWMNLKSQRQSSPKVVSFDCLNSVNYSFLFLNTIKLPPKAPGSTLGRFLGKSGWHFRGAAIVWPVFRLGFRITVPSIVIRKIRELRHRGFWCVIQILYWTDSAISVFLFTARDGSLELPAMPLFGVKSCYLWNLLTV